MPKNNPYFIKNEIKKPVEIVQELNENNWWQKQSSIKKSSLSPSARSKVISKSGSGLQIEKEGYGPCEYSGCSYSSRFYLKIKCSYDFVLYKAISDSTWYPYYGITLENVEQARDFLKKLQKGRDGGIGSYHLQKKGTFSSTPEFTPASQRKQAEIMEELENYIDIHERGGKVYKPMLEICNNDDCSIM